jgi:hypothetical protein
MGCRSGVEVSKQGVEAAVCLGFASRKDVEGRRPRLSKSMSKGCRSTPTSTHRREPTGRPTSAKSGGGFVPKPPRLLADYRPVGRNQVASRSAASYPGLEIIAKLATVLEVEPVEPLSVPVPTRRWSGADDRDDAAISGAVPRALGRADCCQRTMTRNAIRNFDPAAARPSSIQCSRLYFEPRDHLSSAPVK